MLGRHGLVEATRRQRKWCLPSAKPLNGIKVAQKREERIKVTPGSGNVFADMGLPEPEEELTRAQLAILLQRTIKRRRLTRAKAATLMAIDRPKLSALLDGRLGGFSSDRLMRLLMRLGQDIEISVKPKSRGRVRGQIRLLERFPMRWNRERFHLIGNARTGDRCFNGHIPFG
jgi:predicted XRE-type DNA-binding protein